MVRMLTMKKERTSLIGSLGFLSLPEVKGLQSRARSRAARKREITIRVNRAISALKQLNQGELTDELLQVKDQDWKGSPVTKDGQKVINELFGRISGAVEERAPDSPVGVAALQRQQGAAAKSLDPQLKSAKGHLPNRGDLWPAKIEDIALPSGDFPLVKMTEVSRRARRYLDSYYDSMLRTKEERKDTVVRR